MKAARFLWLLLAGCSTGHTGKEQLGDEAWHDARWADAAAAYRQAGESPRVLAKLADATLEGGMLAESVDAWTRLGIAAPDRAAEAAAGLARVAAAADNAGAGPALAAAIVGLRRVAPGWPLGRIGTRLGDVANLDAAAMGQVIPALLAASPGRARAETLLVVLGKADRMRGTCDAAVPILEGVLRTTTMTELRDTATTTLGWCELGLGLSALSAARADDAVRWLDQAAARNPDGAVGRRALVGLGDARASQGDSTAARQAWQAAALAPVPPDSITQLALLRLQQLTPSVIPDSSTVRPGRP